MTTRLRTFRRAASVLIVGAGPSGLALGLLLARAGVSVRIFEARPDPRLGDREDHRSINLTLSARGLRTLARVGLAERVLASGVEIRGRAVHLSKRRVLVQPYGEGQPLLAIPRRTFTGILLEALESEPNVTLEFGARITQIDLDEGRCEVESLKGEQVSPIRAGLIVGADGTWSIVRREILRAVPGDFSQEHFAWSYKQVTIPEPTARRLRFDPACIHVWPRPDALFLAFANPDRSLGCNLFLPRSRFAELGAPGAAEAFLSTRFPDLEVACVVAADEIRRRPESFIPRIAVAPWHYQDRAVLVGDACHAVYHFFAQGLNASLEDCAILSDCLASEPSVGAALAVYESRRRPAAAAIAALSQEQFFVLRDEVRTSRYRGRLWRERLLNRVLGRRWPLSYALVAHAEESYDLVVARLRRRERRAAWAGVGILDALATGCIGLTERLPGRTRAGASILPPESREWSGEVARQ